MTPKQESEIPGVPRSRPDPSYCLELINIGRIIQNPVLASDFTDDDWQYLETKALFETIAKASADTKKTMTVEQLGKIAGVTEELATVGESCTWSQKSNIIEQRIAETSIAMVKMIKERKCHLMREEIQHTLDQMAELSDKLNPERNGA